MSYLQVDKATVILRGHKFYSLDDSLDENFDDRTHTFPLSSSGHSLGLFPTDHCHDSKAQAGE